MKNPAGMKPDVLLRVRQQFADSLGYVKRLKEKLQEEGLAADEMERALQPALSFDAQLLKELAQLERTPKQ